MTLTGDFKQAPGTLIWFYLPNNSLTGARTVPTLWGTSRDELCSNKFGKSWLGTHGHGVSLTLNHRVGGSSPSPPTYLSESEFYVQTLDVDQTLE